MRKMISGKQQEAIKKLSENIVINDDGTLVEIGGNVVLESVEQIGHIVDDYYITLDLEYDNDWNAYLYSDVDYGRYKILKDGVVIGWIVSASGSVNSYGNEIDLQIAPTQQSLIGEWLYITSQEQANEYSIEEDETIEIDETAKQTFENNLKQVEFKKYAPFFTEEQYEALLALIA